jgi:hypothetical protein
MGSFLGSRTRTSKIWLRTPPHLPRTRLSNINFIPSHCINSHKANNKNYCQNQFIISPTLQFDLISFTHSINGMRLWSRRCWASARILGCEIIKCEVEHRLELEHRDNLVESRPEDFKFLKRDDVCLVYLRFGMERTEELWKWCWEVGEFLYLRGIVAASTRKSVANKAISGIPNQITYLWKSFQWCWDVYAISGAAIGMVWGCRWSEHVKNWLREFV